MFGHSATKKQALQADLSPISRELTKITTNISECDKKLDDLKIICQSNTSSGGGTVNDGSLEELLFQIENIQKIIKIDNTSDSNYENTIFCIISNILSEVKPDSMLQMNITNLALTLFNKIDDYFVLVYEGIAFKRRNIYTRIKCFQKYMKKNKVLLN